MSSIIFMFVKILCIKNISFILLVDSISLGIFLVVDLVKSGLFHEQDLFDQRVLVFVNILEEILERVDPILMCYFL